MSNPGNIVGGHKFVPPPATHHSIPSTDIHSRANLNNPQTSDESKQHSKEVLDQEFNGGNVGSASDEGKNPGNMFVSPLPTSSTIIWSLTWV